MLPPHEMAYSPPSSPVSLDEDMFPDSSPANSPSIASMDIEPEEEIRLVDPFSGSYTQSRAKRTLTTTLSSSSNSYKRMRYSSFTDDTPLSSQSTLNDEEILWDKESTAAYDARRTHFDLQNRGLTYISSKFIEDTRDIVTLRDHWTVHEAPVPAKVPIRAFTRSKTAPVNALGNTPSENRTNAVSPSNSRRNGIHLYLSCNNITKLPVELCRMEHLSVLVLRANYITYLPPEIGQLKNLVELNVANNKLKFVPSELLTLSLETLSLHPNPFLQPPSAQHLVSDTVLRFSSHVPPLSELCLRKLLSPLPRGMWETDKEILLELVSPAAWTRTKFPPSVMQALHACAPKVVPSSVVPPGNCDITGPGLCPNHKHHPERHLFVHHAEQRYTWVTEIAGKSTGGAIPIQWRGCTGGCLSFLDAAPPNEESELELPVVELGGLGFDEE